MESRFGRGYKENLGPFGTIRGSLLSDWLPHAKGEDDAIHARKEAEDKTSVGVVEAYFDLVVTDGRAARRRVKDGCGATCVQHSDTAGNSADYGARIAGE